jgi:hypothetical protein
MPAKTHAGTVSLIAVLCLASIRTRFELSLARVHVGVLRSVGAAIYSAISRQPGCWSGWIWRFSAVTRNTASAHPLNLSFLSDP